jgi:hypothetical protein
VTGGQGRERVTLRPPQTRPIEGPMAFKGTSIHRPTEVRGVFHNFDLNATRAETRGILDAPRDHGGRVGSTWEAPMTGRFAEARRRVPAAVVAAALVLLLATGCDPGTSNPTATPSSATTEPETAAPSSSPSETKSETPQERDARLAGDTVVKYWAVVDDLAAHPDKSLNLLDPVARDQARAQMQTLLSTYVAKGLVQRGTSSLTDVVAATKDGKRFTVSACVDVSTVDLVDQKGTSQVNPDRPDQQRYTYSVVKTAEGFFVTEDSLKGKPC